MNAPEQARTLQDLATPPARGTSAQDLVVNMFSAQGFALAQRLANAYMSSNAVPATFRSVITKREKRGNDYVDVEVPNPSAMGNCLVAIETALAVGMSITAVMQNANIIEGRLTWSGKFVIAAINASGRFQPLRFDLVNKGLIKATYKEKGEWNRDQRKYDMIEKEVEIENLVCVAWTLPRNVPIPHNVRTLDDAKAVKLPVIESAPVSMKLAVEEGWYSKPGSKWQTEMKYQMLQYRAGSFFGNIHAPDIVMGMGKTTEEALDTLDAVIQPDGSAAVDLDSLRNTPAPTAAPKRATPDATDVEDTSGKHTSEQAQAQAGGIPAQEAAKASAPASSGGDLVMTFAEVESAINKATDGDLLDVAVDLITSVADDGQRAELSRIAAARRDALANPKAASTRQPRTARTIPASAE